MECSISFGESDSSHFGHFRSWANSPAALDGVAGAARPPPLFGYETAWETHDNLKQTSLDAWTANQPCTRVEDMKQKLASLSGRLKTWNVDTFGSVRKEIKALKRELEKL